MSRLQLSTHSGYCLHVTEIQVVPLLGSLYTVADPKVAFAHHQSGYLSDLRVTPWSGFPEGLQCGALTTKGLRCKFTVGGESAGHESLFRVAGGYLYGRSFLLGSRVAEQYLSQLCELHYLRGARRQAPVDWLLWTPTVGGVMTPEQALYRASCMDIADWRSRTDGISE